MQLFCARFVALAVTQMKQISCLLGKNTASLWIVPEEWLGALVVLLSLHSFESVVRRNTSVAPIACLSAFCARRKLASLGFWAWDS